jgi:uncharacterized Fe-S center protein
MWLVIIWLTSSMDLKIHFYEKQKDKFRGLYHKIDGEIQMKYGQEIGLGSMDYELIKI